MCRQFIQVQVRTAAVLVIIRSRRAFVFALVGIRLAVFHRSEYGQSLGPVHFS